MGMRLYTRNDLERAARLAVTYKDHHYEPGDAELVEAAIAHSLETVMAEVPESYARSDVEKAARSAAILALQGVDVDEAVTAVLLGVRV